MEERTETQNEAQAEESGSLQSAVDALVGRVKLRCPWHGELTPSLVIDFGKGTFHCFGCGRDGKVDGAIVLTSP